MTDPLHAAMIARLADHETTQRRIRRERARQTRRIGRAVRDAAARLARALANRLSAGSAAYR